MGPTVMLVFSQISFKRKKPKPHKKSESTHQKSKVEKVGRIEWNTKTAMKWIDFHMGIYHITDFLLTTTAVNGLQGQNDVELIWK